MKTVPGQSYARYQRLDSRELASPIFKSYAEAVGRTKRVLTKYRIHLLCFVREFFLQCWELIRHSSHRHVDDPRLAQAYPTSKMFDLNFLGAVILRADEATEPLAYTHQPEIL